MITIKEIAEMAGVSIATVSRLINGDENLFLSEEKRKIILKIVDDNGYKTPKNRNKIKKILIVSWLDEATELKDKYYSGIRASVEKCVIENKWIITRAFYNENGYDESTLMGHDGLIAIGKFSAEQIELFNKVCETVVFVDSSPNENIFNSVVVNYEQGMKSALNYVLNTLNINNIHYISGKEYTADNTLCRDYRLKAYVEKLKELSIFNGDNVYIGDYSIESGYKMAEELFSNTTPEIIITANESITFGVLKFMYNKNIRIPDDVKVICFSSQNDVEYTTPSLTNVHLPIKEMGVHAFKLMVNAFAKETVKCKIQLSTELIIRESA